MKDFKNKVVVITGAGSGIGRALASKCAQRGAQLALCDVDTPGLEKTAKLCGHADVMTQQVDVSERGAVEAFRDKVAETYGHVDAVFNNAGVAHAQTIEDTAYEDFEWIMGINFWGVVYGSKAFLPLLRKGNDAALVNVSSVFGLLSVPTQGTYNATKFAVRGFTEALRHETAGTGLHVMCVHPGGIKTNIAQNARFHTAPGGGTDHESAAALFDKIAMTRPERAADKILKDLAHNKGRSLIGLDAVVLDAVARLAPQRYWSAFSRFMPE